MRADITSAWTARAIPKGLTREQMSVQARVMGIADIFEALTAKDRPYKEGKTLTESLDDPGQVQAERTHRSRSVRCVHPRKGLSRLCETIPCRPEQIDDVDESKIPGYIP